MAGKKYTVAVTGMSGEDGRSFQEGQVITREDLGSTFDRHQKLGSFRDATKEDEEKWNSTQIERGQMPAAAASELTTGNETEGAQGAGAKGKVSATDQGEDLSELTVPELRERAAQLEIAGTSQMNKADLIAAIEEAESE